MIAQLTGKPASPAAWIALLSGDNEQVDQYLADEIYTKNDPAYLQTQKARFIDTLSCHQKRFGDGPCYLLRAPGRLNGFLEYLDMCAGDHMSTTIDGDIPMVLSVRDDDTVVIHNTLPIFPEKSFSISETLKTFKSAPWGEGPSAGLEDNWDNRTRVYPYYGRQKGDHANYCIASFLRFAWDNPDTTLCGASMTFGPSTIPLRAGTSSSSAVVVLSSFACLLANRGRIEEPTLPVLCNLLGQAEWYVGTHGGANDQTTILRNHANGILYNRHSRTTLDATPLPFLKGVRIVLANTLWEANKALGASYTFNLRKGWMDLGSDLLEKVINACASHKETVEPGWVWQCMQANFPWPLKNQAFPRLDKAPWDLIKKNYKLFGSLDEGLLGVPQPMIAELIQLLPDEITPETAGQVLGKTETDLGRDYTLPDQEGGVWRPKNAALFFNKENMIGRELTRYFLEAQAELDSGVSPASPQYQFYIREVSRLVNAVQDTIRHDFKVSNDQIELILSIARQGPGHLAGKLTGAGCGGCVCIFVTEDQADDMCRHLDENYYGVSGHFDAYRQTLAAIPDQAVREEMQGNLDRALSDMAAQRRVVAFSQGACILTLPQTA